MEMNSYLPSDDVLAVVVPIVVYWIYSGVYMLLGSLNKYKLHTSNEEDMKNLVSKREVAITVLLQQLVQASVAFLTFTLSRDDEDELVIRKQNSSHRRTSTIGITGQCFVAMFVFDTWQYFWHRYLHMNKFLYKHIHSWHHRLIVPYCFGAQYNHPIEGFLLDTIGGALAFLISGMTTRTSIFFFSFSVIKGIDDHCGLWLPGNVFHILFGNNTAYHDVHHQLYGSKYNFSQPFFVFWDKIMGTYMPYEIVKRDAGGLEVRPVNRKSS